MSTSFLMAEANSASGQRGPTRNGLYRAIAIITTFAMLFGGLLLMPAPVGATSAVTTARLNMRAEPSPTAALVTVIPSGVEVSVDGDAVAGYYPVTYDGASGYAAADWIQIGGSSDDPTPGDVTGGAPAGPAWVATARLNFRNGPSLGAGVITVLTSGAAVTLTGQQSGEYWEAQAVGTTGWLASAYLTTSDPGGTDPGTTDPGPSDPGTVGVGDVATGTATVTTRLNLRQGPGTGYGVVTVMPVGALVELRGDAQSGYYPLSYNGTTGWAAGDWLTIGGTNPTPEPTPDPGSGAVPVGDVATGSATTTAGLNLRQGPGTGYAVITVMPVGAVVELRGDPQGGYYPLSYNGTTGWAAGDWLTIGTTPTPTPEPTPTPNPGDGTVPVGDVATGSATTTAGLNLRQGPGITYAVVTVMPNGATVELRGDAQNGYYPLSYNGTTGWAAGDWLTIGTTPTPTPEPTPTPNPGGGGTVPVGDVATGSATTTAGLNLRQGPGMAYAVITVMPNGATVELRGDPQSGYYPLSYNGTTGWAAGDWLTIGGTNPTPTPEPTPTPDPGDGSHPQYLYTEFSVNMRSGPGISYGIVTTVPPKTRVTISGPQQGGWYPAGWAGSSGYMRADLLVESLNATYPPEKQPIVDIIYAAADRYGQPREDMLRVAMCESSLDPTEVNPYSGASGLFQFMPGTWQTTPYADQSIFDPTASANAAGWMWSVGRRGEWACQ